MKTNLIILAVVIVLAVGGYFAYTYMQSKTTSETSTETTSEDTNSQEAKINIDAVCENALAYMTFTDGASADAFVADCKEGKHPEVIEQYKASLNLDAGVAI